MANLKYTTIETLENELLGEIGTPRRDAFEEAVAEEIRAYHIGEAIKAARKERNLTQDQLAELMGVKKAQVSRIERGMNPTLNTITRAFRALGMAVSLNWDNKSIALT